MRSCMVLTPAAGIADARGLRVLASQHVEAYTGSADATALLRWMRADSNSADNAAQCLGPLVSKRFSFDRVWDLDAECAGGATSNAQHAQSLYTRALSASIAGAVEGRNICLITHGCTLTGRTNLVCGGDPASSAALDGRAGPAGGLVGLALRDLYSAVQSKSSSSALFQLVASVVSIQTERVRDLLYFDGTPLKIVTDPAHGGTTVAGGRRVRVRSATQIAELVHIVRTGATMNPAAHIVLTVQIEHLDLRMASDLSARGLQDHLHSAINRVSTVQIAHLAGAEFALTRNALTTTRNGATAASAVASNAARCSSPSDPLLLAAQRWNRDPTVVKQAQLALLKKRRHMQSASSYAHPAAPALSASAAINVPKSEVEQKSLAKSFDCLERVLMQLAAQPSLGDVDTQEASRPPTPTSVASFDASSSSAAAASHVSYRSSALTWLLTDTLRAHPSAHVVLLGFLSPSVAATKQSLHSLRFGGRVHEVWEKRRAREEARANHREQAAMAQHAAAFTPLHSQQLGAMAPEELEADLVWDVQQYLRKHALSSPAASPAADAASLPSQPATVRKEVSIHDAPPTPSLQPLQRSHSILSTPSPSQPLAAAATQKLPTPQHQQQQQQQPLTPPLSAPARSTPSQLPLPAEAAVSTSPQNMAEALDAYLAHGSTPQPPTRPPHVSFAPASASSRPTQSSPAQHHSPVTSSSRVPVSLFSPRCEQVNSATTTPLAAPSSAPRVAAAYSSPPQQPQQHQPLISPASIRRQIRAQSRTPSPQICDPTCCSLAVSVTPAAAAGSGSFASPLPSRLLDVLEVLRSGGPAPLAARTGSSTAAECDQLAAEWPYHRDLVLHELTDQLAAWRSEQQQQQQQQQSSSSPTADRARMRQRVDELAAIFGDRIPLDALEALMREEESLVRQSLGFGSPEPEARPAQTQPPQQTQPQQQQQGRVAEEELDVENAFQRGLGGANRRFVSTPTAADVPSKLSPAAISTPHKPAAASAMKKTRAAAVNTPARSKIPVRVQQPPTSVCPPPQQPQHPTQQIPAPISPALLPSAAPLAAPVSAPVLTADESWLAAQMGDVKSQMRVLTSQLQALAGRLPQHSSEHVADVPAGTEAQSQPEYPAPFAAAAPSSDALYASAAAVHSAPSSSASSAATLSYRDPQGNVAELELRTTSTTRSDADYSPTSIAMPAVSFVPFPAVAAAAAAGSRASSRRPSQVKVSSELSSALAHQARMQETLKQAEMLIASMQQQAAAAAAAVSLA